MTAKFWLSLSAKILLGLSTKILLKVNFISTDVPAKILHYVFLITRLSVGAMKMKIPDFWSGICCLILRRFSVAT
jgi:hypothetical protein